MDAQTFHILVAEDNLVNLKLMKRILGMMNHHVETALDGFEVLQRLENHKYDFILMDVQMPKLDGLETTRKIISSKDPSDRPIIIAMTANAMKGDRERCLEAGMDDYISKPVMIKDLGEKLIYWGRQRHNRSLTERAENPQVVASPPVYDPFVDWQRLEMLRMILADPGALQPLFDTFFTQSRNRLTAMRQEMQEHRSAGIRDKAHSLKGACLNFGALHTAGLCMEMEQLSPDFDMPAISDLMNRLENSMELTISRMMEWIRSQP